MSQYVMADIHGNKKRFDAVMKQIGLQPDDTLYVLGDVIDRYDDGIRILRRLMTMPNVRMIRGNHEQMMLDAIGTSGECTPVDGESMKRWINNGGDVTLKRFKRLRKRTRREILAYLSALPYTLTAEANGKRYLLVHAAPPGLYESDRARYAQYHSAREFSLFHRLREHEPVGTEHTLIFGHTPTIYYQSDEPLRIYRREDRIGIDCGAGLAPPGSPFYYADGRLACLRLDDMKEFYSD